MLLDKELEALINREFLSDENTEASLKRLTAALHAGVAFKVRDKVVNHLPVPEMKEVVFESMPAEGAAFEDVLTEFDEKIAYHSTNFGSRNFMAFPDCGNATAALSGAILMNFLNQNLINSKHCAPAASIAEINVIQWLRGLVGYEVIEDTRTIFDVGGIVVTGGVLANATAMLLAREHMFPDTKANGVTFDPTRVKVIIPQYVDHYSIRASLGWLGMGETNVLRVKATDFRIDVADLKRIIAENEGKNKIMALVAYAGDSRSMTIDHFEELGAIAKEHGIWFHIDACHGLQYAFSEKLRPKLGPIEIADSITVDPHKILFLPYNLSAILVKDPESLRKISGTSDLIMKEDHAFGQITPFIGSKAFWSLKLWFMWKTLGTRNIGRLIEYRHALAVYLSDKLKKDRDFIVLNEQVNINSVIFMYMPSGVSRAELVTDGAVETLNALNKAVQDRLFCEGDFYVHTFSIPDLGGVLGSGERMLQPMRYMCGNPITRTKDLDAMVERVRAIGKEMEALYFPALKKTA